MSRILTLTKVMMKSSSDNLLPQKNKTLTLIGLGIVFVYLAGFAGYASYYIISMFHNLSQAGMSIYLLLSAITLYLLFVCFIMVPSIYYFSQDIQRYLVLPISAREFMVARFLSTLIKLYASLSIIYIPFGIVYISVVGFSLQFIIYYLLVGIFIPLIPLIISLIVVVVAFTFVPFFRNKNLFTYITTGLALVFALTINMLSMNSGDPDAMLEALMVGIESGTNTVVSLMNSLFPHIHFFIDALVYNKPLSLVIGIVISLGVVIVAIFLIQGLYIKSALSIQEETTSSKKLSKKQFDKKSRQSGTLWALVKIDMKNILRTPLFATNYFVMLVILPVIIMVPIIQEGGISGISAIFPDIQAFIASIPLKDLIIYGLCGSFLLSFFFGAFAMISSTALSREGKTMTQFKLLPVKMITIINAKLVLSVLCLMTPMIILIVTLGILLKLNPLLVVAMILFSIVGSLVSNILNIFLDVYKPKLQWTQEQEAIKQNFLAIIPMFTILGLGGLMIFSLLNSQSFDSVLIVYTLAFTVLGAIIYLVIRKLCRTHLPNLIS